ncbi:MAG: hypothetical protein N2645_18995 [Clostridia bacterium]|nr:hypothetical protein [Clostridia bacterium]
MQMKKFRIGLFSLSLSLFLTVQPTSIHSAGTNSQTYSELEKKINIPDSIKQMAKPAQPLKKVENINKTPYTLIIQPAPKISDNMCVPEIKINDSIVLEPFKNESPSPLPIKHGKK